MTTDVFAIPELTTSQASKEETHNEALRLVELLLASSVIDKDLSTPPGSPVAGNRYIVKTTGLTGWAGHDEDLTMFSGGGWIFIQPIEGTTVYVQDEDKYYRFNGTAWVASLPQIIPAASITFNPANAADGAGETATTITVTGAVLGDFAIASFSLSLQGILLTAYVSAADTVTCRFQNETGGAIDLASGTLRVLVLKA